MTDIRGDLFPVANDHLGIPFWWVKVSGPGKRVRFANISSSLQSAKDYDDLPDTVDHSRQAELLNLMRERHNLDMDLVLRASDAYS